MADAQDANAEHEPQPSSSTASIPGVVRAFLRGDLSRVDKRLPEWMEVLSGVGAGECWHKKSRCGVSDGLGWRRRDGLKWAGRHVGRAGDRARRAVCAPVCPHLTVGVGARARAVHKRRAKEP